MPVLKRLTTNKNNMKIEKIKVEGGYICRNPMTGTWFVWIGESRGAKYMAKNKRDAIQTAKEMGGGNLIIKASTH